MRSEIKIIDDKIRPFIEWTYHKMVLPNDFDGTEYHHWGFDFTFRDFFILKYFFENDFAGAKQVCFDLLKLMEGRYYNFKQNETFSPLTLENYSFFSIAILCDKIELLQKFQHFDYPVYNFSKNVENRQFFIKKQGAPYSYAMQCIINKDWAALNDLIGIFKIEASKTIWKSRHFELHIAIWESIRDRRVLDLQLGLQNLIKITHKTFSSGTMWGEYLSMPAIGYLKAAWYIGLEVEVSNKLIPMDLIPIKPLTDYKKTFQFFLD